MKKCLFIVTMVLFSVNAMSQQNLFTLSGGYASANIEDSGSKGTGWRMNGLYEFNAIEGSFAHGVSFGYINLNSTDGSTKYTINSFPVYYAPKYMFGKEKVKFYVKGALGMQYAGLKREGPLASLDDNDFGFYGGGGTGLMLFVKENIFLVADYEIAWASNSWYKDGWISSVSGGIGFKF